MDSIDKYIHHLRARLRGKMELRVTEDIMATPEGNVASKGDILVKQDYQRLSRLQLHKDLESLVCVDNVLSCNDIYKLINKEIEKDKSYSIIDQELSNASVLSQCCDTLKPYPILREMLTIFQIEAQDIFEQSLLSAYLTYIVGLINKYSQKGIEAAFLAGLFHDIGLLFINPNCLDKTKRLSAEEWHEMQLHPIIAFKLLKCTEDFPGASRKAILEHHERPDGSGYPQEKTEADIDKLASLISLLDDVIVIYNKRFKPLKRSIQNILPIIQMNTFGYEQTSVSAITKALKMAPEPAVEDVDKDVVKDLVDYTYQQQLYINKIMDVINQVNDIIGFDHNVNPLNAIQIMSKQIASVIASAGLQEASYLELLQRLNNEDHKKLHLEVEQTRLMMEEIFYQLGSYYKAANLYSSKKINKHAKEVALFIDVFQATEKPKTPDSLLTYWDTLR